MQVPSGSQINYVCFTRFKLRVIHSATSKLDHCYLNLINVFILYILVHILLELQEKLKLKLKKGDMILLS